MWSTCSHRLDTCDPKALVLASSPLAIISIGLDVAIRTSEAVLRLTQAVLVQTLWSPQWEHTHPTRATRGTW